MINGKRDWLGREERAVSRLVRAGHFFLYPYPIANVCYGYDLGDFGDERIHS